MPVTQPQQELEETEPTPSAPSALVTEPWRKWEFAFLALLGSSMILSVWLITTRRYLSFDDLVTAVLVAEPSLWRMIKAIANGVDVNPPLFFILQWLAARVWGNSDLALRMFSALSVALAVPVLYLALRPAIRARLAALAVALIIGLSRDVLAFGTDARYYGWLILLTAIAAYWFARSYREPLARRQLVLIFLTHAALVYTHLFGFFFSGAVLLAHLIVDALRRQLQWRLYGTFVVAWSTFLLWLPVLSRQLSVTKHGTFTPRINVGSFLEELEMQTPLPLVLLFSAGLAALWWLSQRSGEKEEHSPPALSSLTVLLTLGVLWMAVPVAAWAASHLMQPFFMRRYVSPCVNAWVLISAVFVAALYQSPLRNGSTRLLVLPRWCHHVVFTFVLGFCIVWQPLRAWTEPPKGPPFVDSDYGNSMLPIVFENPMDFLPRVYYGDKRRYVLLLHRGAAEASPNYYTKLVVNYLERWRPFFPEMKIIYYDELAAGPEGYLAVDGELAKTFEWIFENDPKIQRQLLGDWEGGNKVYVVRSLQR
jgi:hypothetical protein